MERDTSRKRYTAEQIIGVLREAELLLSQRLKAGEVSRRSICTSLSQKRSLIVSLFLAEDESRDAVLINGT